MAQLVIYKILFMKAQHPEQGTLRVVHSKLYFIARSPSLLTGCCKNSQNCLIGLYEHLESGNKSSLILRIYHKAQRYEIMSSSVTRSYTVLKLFFCLILHNSYRI